MIQINKKTFNNLVAAVIALVILSGALIFVNEDMRVSRLEEVKSKDIEIAVAKTKIENLQTLVTAHKRVIRKQDEEYAKLDQSFTHNTEVYTSKIAELKKNKEKVREVLKPYENDSVLLATHILEREECLKANEIILTQRDILNSKIEILNEIIISQDSMLILKDKIIVNTEDKVNIYKKENKKLQRKIKIARFTNKIGIIAVAVGGVLLLTL